MNTTQQTNSDRPFRILSIDGGGSKGIYSAMLLHHVEKALGCPAHEHFDLIAGTSTGGIIALASAYGIPARTTAQIYLKRSKDIFPDSESKKRKFRQYFRRAKYSPEGLRAVLTEHFHQSMIGDCKTHVLIPTFSLVTGNPWIIKKDHEGLPGRDDLMSLVDAAMATSAAPTYFPVHTSKDREGSRFVDGGIFANNPSVLAYTEARRFHVGEGKTFKSVSILSIPSVKVTADALISSENQDMSFYNWKDYLIDAMGAGQECAAHYNLKTLAACSDIPLKYHRMKSPELGIDMLRKIRLDTTDPNILSVLYEKGDNRGIQDVDKLIKTKFFN